MTSRHRNIAFSNRSYCSSTLNVSIETINLFGNLSSVMLSWNVLSQRSEIQVFEFSIISIKLHIKMKRKMSEIRYCYQIIMNKSLSCKQGLTLCQLYTCSARCSLQCKNLGQKLHWAVWYGHCIFFPVNFYRTKITLHFLLCDMR